MSNSKTPKSVGKSNSGNARARSLTPEKRREISQKGVDAKRELSNLPKATHGSADHPLKLGDVEITCYVLEDGTRVLSQRGLQTSLGMSVSGGSGGEQRIAVLMEKIHTQSIELNELSVRITQVIERIKNPIKFRPTGGGGLTFGFEATLLADICEVFLMARKDGVLRIAQARYADQCEILVRGFARVGIIALVDEATGYQDARAKNALAQILEKFVAKELQPWVKTFPVEYYKELCRLYGVPFPPPSGNFPQFFGHITNNAVYSRLAPELLPELKKAASKQEKKARLHQYLTSDVGHPKLREHLSSIVTLLKLSDEKEKFLKLVDKIHPRYNENYTLDFED
ncbi:hypothetical protein ICN32_10890 [Polynucleobacter wuianus]|jgi:hypothetical protein|uniref:P63C domain-containing protein n=1 Tax=Polynucleobacter wuianus TaxID=1743168 RepID=UPI001C0C448F|nr:P63C domain-containing protein [Polynucleobacter wuianus]MBU3611059.1 hypothetical protein [Polynucleobacter wuianus]